MLWFCPPLPLRASDHSRIIGVSVKVGDTPSPLVLSQDSYMFGFALRDPAAIPYRSG